MKKEIKIHGEDLTVCEDLNTEAIAECLEKLGTLVPHGVFSYMVSVHNYHLVSCGQCETPFLPDAGKVGKIPPWNWGTSYRQGRRHSNSREFCDAWPSYMSYCLPCALTHTDKVVEMFKGLTKRSDQLYFLRSLATTVEHKKRESNWTGSFGCKFFVKLSNSLMPYVNTRGHRAVGYLTRILAACNMV